MKQSKPLTYARAKSMRKAMTEAERKLWGALRNRSLGGLKFYRQVPVGPFIVDFMNKKFGVIIEVDGVSHTEDSAITYDARREGYLRRLGFEIHRVNNRDVYIEMSSMLDGIYRAVMDAKNKREGTSPSQRFASGPSLSKGEGLD